MKKSSAFTVAALSIMIGLSVGACADSTPMNQAANQASLPGATTAVNDYNHGVNPEVNVPVTGTYDQADRYRTANGFPLPGESQMLYGQP